MIQAVDAGLGSGHDLVDHRDPAAVSRRLVSARTGAARRYRAAERASAEPRHPVVASCAVAASSRPCPAAAVAGTAAGTACCGGAAAAAGLAVVGAVEGRAVFQDRVELPGLAVRGVLDPEFV